jgi:hypothetical protein
MINFKSSSNSLFNRSNRSVSLFPLFAFLIFVVAFIAFVTFAFFVLKEVIVLEVEEGSLYV